MRKTKGKTFQKDEQKINQTIKGWINQRIFIVFVEHQIKIKRKSDQLNENYMECRRFFFFFYFYLFCLYFTQSTFLFGRRGVVDLFIWCILHKLFGIIYRLGNYFCFWIEHIWFQFKFKIKWVGRDSKTQYRSL